MIDDYTSRTKETWRRINMRRVEHLLGVEFIHDLYNQHVFTINSLRFRNTITFWKEGVVNSYAPESEWNALLEIFGERFFNLDPTLLKELNNLYALKRNFADRYIEKLANTEFVKCTDEELNDLLQKLQYFTLGDFYRLNFVQVEYALTQAIKRELVNINENPELLSRLIVSSKPTAYQEEEIALSRIFSLANDSQIKKQLKKHYEKYAFMHSAYGEKPYSFEYYVDRYKNSSGQKERQILKEIGRSAKESKKLLRSLNSQKLNILVPLMIKGGEFRDANKARLGISMKWKFTLLDEVSRRKKIERQDLNFYSLKNIDSLLRQNIFLPNEILLKRKQEGVVLIRREGLTELPVSSTVTNFYEVVTQLEKNSEDSSGARELVLNGNCASSGEASGTARIVFSYEDGEKVQPGDIMIAIGTDFDLMDAIQRAAAVVTEEGGLLSHASVVCRELNKPCCIGVENATVIIKDGDVISLDATNGIVKITRT